MSVLKCVFAAMWALAVLGVMYVTTFTLPSHEPIAAPVSCYSKGC